MAVDPRLFGDDQQTKIIERHDLGAYVVDRLIEHVRWNEQAKADCADLNAERSRLKQELDSLLPTKDANPSVSGIVAGVDLRDGAPSQRTRAMSTPSLAGKIEDAELNALSRRMYSQQKEYAEAAAGPLLKEKDTLIEELKERISAGVEENAALLTTIENQSQQLNDKDETISELRRSYAALIKRWENRKRVAKKKR